MLFFLYDPYTAPDQSPTADHPFEGPTNAWIPNSHYAPNKIEHSVPTRIPNVNSGCTFPTTVASLYSSLPAHLSHSLCNASHSMRIIVIRVIMMVRVAVVI
jgi:hypothetical protein